MADKHQQAYEDWAKKTIAKELAMQDDLLPPWQRHPEIPPGSLGWRMGHGETYMVAWDQWANQLKQEQLIEYFKKYAPIPIEWLSWVSYRFGDKNIAQEILSGGGNFNGIHWLEQQGLANFSEFKSWYESWYKDWQLKKATAEKRK
jgi:hypothetical protein